MRTKKVTFGALVAVTVVTVFTFSCKKSAHNDNNPPLGMSASITGSAISPVTIGSLPGGAVNYNNNQYFMIPGVGYNGAPALDTFLINITLPKAAIINHPMSTDTSFATDVDVVVRSKAGEEDYYAGQGDAWHAIVTLTSLDTVNHKIAGTFNGTIYDKAATDSVIVANGKFNTTYTITP